jgi:hypothetical protein
LQPDWNKSCGYGAGIAGASAFARLRLAARRLRRLAALALALGQAAPAPAAEPAKAEPPPAVELDRLLKLPSTVEQVQREQIGSATKSQWRARFASARAEHEAALAGLEAAQKKLGTVAEDSEAWQMAPPGAGAAGASEAPVDYQLRQELRRQREDLIRSEKNLRELTIEADLAGVPADWRE